MCIRDSIYSSKILTGGVKIIQPSVYHEQRGEIWSIYHSDYYDRLIPIEERERGVQFKHDRYSKSEEGVLRGLHWDDKTWKEHLKGTTLKRIKPWMWRRNINANLSKK